MVKGLTFFPKIIKNISCSYLLQWEIIKDAKKRGCDTYNFWGISSPDNNLHPWYGTYLFKKKFVFDITTVQSN